MQLAQVGAIIKKYRDDRNMSLDTVRSRAQMEIGQSTLADLEAGKHPPSKKTRSALVAAYGWPNDWFERLLADDRTFMDEPENVDTEAVSQLRGEVATLSDRVVELSNQVGDLMGAVRELRAGRAAGGSAQ